ncbi:MAG: RNA methyltransferase [Novosphingobium sp.]|nr:RNA methyltransferase [Novosphingobium sp.]
MTPQARVQAAIEVLDAVIAAARGQGAGADKIVADFFRARRYMGSGDRRAVRELTYRVIRHCGEVPASGRSAMLGLIGEDEGIFHLFDGSPHGPAPIVSGEIGAAPSLAPVWLLSELAASGIAGDDAKALLERAPLDIRINALKGEPELPLAGEPTQAPAALRYPHGTPVEQWDAFRAGQIEVQDSGSQITCLAVAAAPGETVIDLCAGAGGKTLALAAAMDNRGRLVACDVDRARLSRLEPRAQRAGATIIETRLLGPGQEHHSLGDLTGQADAVLVDAPCSGTGTWRRNPEARWRLNAKELARVTAIQARLLDLAATLLRPGGRLVFVTCSLLDSEGADQAAAFLARHPDWRATTSALPAGTARGAGFRLEPARDATDGFFVAQFTAP